MARAKLKKVTAELRDYALSFPGAKEEFPWGDRVVKVKGRIFAFLGDSPEGFGLSVKLPESGEMALALPFTEPTPYNLGKSGWVSALFPPGKPVPVGLVKEWILESYRAVAPKRVLALLDQEEARPKPGPAPRAKRSRRRG